MKVVLSGITENSSVRGVERYVFELARYLVSGQRVDSVVLLAGDWQRYYEPLVDLGVRLEFVSGLKNSKISRHFFHFLTIRKYFTTCDVLHVCNTLPIFNPFRKPFVVTIHDLAEYYVPDKYGFIQRYYRRLVARLAVSQALEIVTVSNFSKKVICDSLGVSDNKVTAVYNGCEHLKGMSNVPLRISNFKYVLYWGVVERTKGLGELVAAMSLVREDFPDLHLIIVGKKGNAWPDIEMSVSDSPWIDYLGYVDDVELVGLIKGAAVVAFPSVYEGFGFPAVEAFIYNDNVVASSTTALGEITSGFATRVDPSSARSIANGIVCAVAHPKKFDESEKARILRDFSWQTCANSCVDIYQKSMSRSR